MKEEIIDEWTTSEEEENRKEVMRHNMPHDEKCCGAVAKIPFYVAYQEWIKSKLKKASNYKDINIFKL